jgi:hypothetical protein
MGCDCEHFLMLNIVTWQWNNGFRDYTPKRVNALAGMLQRQMQSPYRLVCITDDTKGFGDLVEIMQTPDAARRVVGIPSPEGSRFPSSYRRLWLFSDEARALGEWVLNLDLDCLVTADLTPLLEGATDFVGWRPNSIWGQGKRIGGGTWLLRTGTHRHVWDEFSPGAAAVARAAGWRGSDQAWISYQLAETCAVWPRSAGIYQTQDGIHKWNAVPLDARIVHFNGNKKPWHCKHVPWVREHYR